MQLDTDRAEMSRDNFTLSPVTGPVNRMFRKTEKR